MLPWQAFDVVRSTLLYTGPASIVMYHIIYSMVGRSLSELSDLWA